MDAGHQVLLTFLRPANFYGLMAGRPSPTVLPPIIQPFATSSFWSVFYSLGPGCLSWLLAPLHLTRPGSFCLCSIWTHPGVLFSDYALSIVYKQTSPTTPKRSRVIPFEFLWFIHLVLKIWECQHRGPSQGTWLL